MAQYDGSIRINTLLNTSGLRRGEGEIRGSMSRISDAAKKMTAVIASAFALRKVVQFGKEMLDLGSDLQEVQNVVDVTFTTMSDKVDKFAKNAAVSAGLSETMAKKYVGTFGAMSKSFGFSEQAAYDMSTALTQLSGDVASFYNISQDEAYIKLKSVFTGETETLKDLGVVMTQSALDAYALANGFGKTTSAMSENEKVALRFQFVMQQLSGASGDFMRTSGGWANQVRILKLQFDSLKATIGQGLINIFTPVVKIINVLLGKLATLANAFKAFTELITGNKAKSGGSTGLSKESGEDIGAGYNAAADGAENLAAANNDAAKSAGKAAKAAKGQLSTLDKLNNISSQSSGSGSGGGGAGGGSGGAFGEVDYGSLSEGETVVDKLNKKLLHLKEILSGLVKPFKDAWEAEGASTVEAARFAFESLGNLAKSVAKSFYDVWTNGTGTQTLTLILQIAQNVLTTIGNIASRLNEAWNTNNVGTSIIQNIFNIFNTILGTIERITGATAEWAARLDFTPLLTSINSLLESIQPLTENIGDGLAWFYENVLLPIAGWTIQEAVPAFLDMLSAAIGAVNEVIEALKPLGIWLWENFLQPLGQWAGEVVIAAMETITGLLTKFSDWISENQSLVEGFVIVIGSFFAAWGVVNLATTIAGIVAALTTFVTTGGLAASVATLLGGAIAFLTSPITIAIAIIGSLIAVGVLLYKNWDTIKEKAIQIWGSIRDWFKETIEKIKEFFSGLWSGIKETFANVGSWFKEKFSAAFSGIKNAFSSVGEFFSGVWSNIKGVFGNISGWFKDKFSAAWEAVKKVFSAGGKIFDGIKGGILNGLKAVINAIIRGINKVIAIPFNGLNAALKKIKSIDILGLKPFNWISPIKVPQITPLATGTVVPPNREFLALLGDNKKEPEVVSPISTMKQAVMEAIAESGITSGGGSDYGDIVVTIDGREVFRAVKKQAAEYKKQTGGKLAFT